MTKRQRNANSTQVSPAVTEQILRSVSCESVHTFHNAAQNTHQTCDNTREAPQTADTRNHGPPDFCIQS